MSRLKAEYCPRCGRPVRVWDSDPSTIASGGRPRTTYERVRLWVGKYEEHSCDAPPNLAVRAFRKLFGKGAAT